MTIHLERITPKSVSLQVDKLWWLNKLRSIARAIRRDFERPTKHWSHKPEFKLHYNIVTGGCMTIQIETTDDIYTMLDKGTPHRPIWAKGAGPSGKPAEAKIHPETGEAYRVPLLKWHRMVLPATRPNSLESSHARKELGGGGAGTFFYATRVIRVNKGIRARNFEKQVNAIWEGTNGKKGKFYTEINALFLEWVTKSNLRTFGSNK